MQQAPFSFPKQTNFYRGKVRDVYTIGTDRLVMIASNRISAFDVILPKPIPHKGQVLNQLAAYMLESTRDICPNWLLSIPAPTVSYGIKCIPFKIEMVVRGHLVGHAWRSYKSGERVLCGATMPDGLKENDPFPNPIITPSTKAAAGHDEDISPEAIVAQGLCTSGQWEVIKTYALALFERGKSIANKQGLILADTKYEFGQINNEVYLMDEVHTPDSSRYFYADGFADRQQRGEKQQQMSKEFVREWLMENDFMGKEGQQVPQMTDEWIQIISSKYVELYEKVSGHQFIPEDITDEMLMQRVLAVLQ